MGDCAHSFTTRLAGLRHVGPADVVSAMIDGLSRAVHEGGRVVVVLRREPDNRHDAYAIAVDVAAVHAGVGVRGERDQPARLGYLPRRVARDYAALLDAGLDHDATVVEACARSRRVVIKVVFRDLSEAHARVLDGAAELRQIEAGRALRARALKRASRRGRRRSRIDDAGFGGRFTPPGDRGMPPDMGQ